MLYAARWCRAANRPTASRRSSRRSCRSSPACRSRSSSSHYFTEGTVPAVYISPGDPNMTPTQVKELQDALNGIAGDPAYHLKVIVLPPGSKVEPQRPVDLAIRSTPRADPGLLRPVRR